MGSNLERDIERKSLLLKKGIKDLQSLIGRVYTSAREANNNKLIFIKRSVDKLSSVSSCLGKLEFHKTKDSRASSFNKEIEDLYSDTLKSIDKMQKLFKRQEAAEKKDSRYQGRFHADQRNLDNLRLAHSNIRQMGVGLNMSKHDWNEIEKK